jgi:hypothetical protein
MRPRDCLPAACGWRQQCSPTAARRLPSEDGADVYRTCLNPPSPHLRPFSHSPDNAGWCGLPVLSVLRALDGALPRGMCAGWLRCRADWLLLLDGAHLPRHSSSAIPPLPHFHPTLPSGSQHVVCWPSSHHHHSHLGPTPTPTARATPHHTTPRAAH